MESGEASVHPLDDVFVTYYVEGGILSGRMIIIALKGDDENVGEFTPVYAGPVDGLSMVVDPNGEEWVVGSAMRCSIHIGRTSGMPLQMYLLDRAMHLGIGQERPPARRWGDRHPDETDSDATLKQAVRSLHGLDRPGGGGRGAE